VLRHSELREAALLMVGVTSEMTRVRAELRDHYSGLPLDPPIAEPEIGSPAA